ncbi:hypothetical protein SK128_024817 [Halocaridina rubra]|uniref:Uncharacterized protein n=1 Tax=Halocaridina rubra TaxID=373956 RepID=A0AAN8XBN2_HALRR
MVNGVTINGLGEVALDQGTSLINLGKWRPLVSLLAFTKSSNDRLGILFNTSDCVCVCLHPTDTLQHYNRVEPICETNYI